MLIPLNPEQRAAVEHGDGPLMVLAGAGTGKTRVLVQRIARLVESGTAPWEILAVTFTNKAAGEMRARLRELLGEAANSMWIGTFHSTCARLLRKFGDAIGLTRSFQIFDDDDQMKLVEKLLKETANEEQVTARTILSKIDRAKNRGVDPTDRNERIAGPYDDILDRVYPLYQAQLAKENAVDFNDLLLKIRDLFDHEKTRGKLRGRFRHVLVDEFQDTNLVQYDLVRRFAEVTRNLTVVGDDDQSIYAWRGAEPRNLLDFDRDFPDARVIKLEQNYRSTQTILDAANGIISKNRDRHAKQLWTERGGGELIEQYVATDERSEAYHVAYAIRRLLDEGPHSPGEIAILYRTNAQSRVLEEHLRAARIPARVVGAVSFFERKEVKDVVAYLRLLTNASADSAFERVVGVTRGLGEATVERLRAAARASGLGLYDAARLAARGDVSAIGAAPRRKLLAFVELVEGLRDVIAQGASVAETIIQIVDRSGMRQKYETDDNSESRDRLENLAELVTIASDFDDAAAEAAEGDAGEGDGVPALLDDGGTGQGSDAAIGAGIAGFLERIALSHSSDESGGGSSSPQGEAVVLMTIHIAKGLEWPIVFITGLEDGLFPSLREREGTSEDAALEEERRLAYVAITRARQRLFLSYARTRRTWGEIRAADPSRFLFDLPPESVAVARRHGTTIPPRSMPGSGPRLGSMRTDPVRQPTRHRRDPFDQRGYSGDDELPVYRVDDDLPKGEVFRSGDNVSHELHGLGTVIAVSGSGADTKVIVDFPAIGRKTIFAKYLVGEAN